MIDRERDGDELKETFKVLGSTGNVRGLRDFLFVMSLMKGQVYTVVIGHTPRCDCKCYRFA